MMWHEAALYERVRVGADATRNPVFELSDTGSAILVRAAPAAPRKEAVEGNGFDALERTFLTKCAPSRLEGAAAIEVRGSLYEICGVSTWSERGGVVAIRAKRFK